MKRFLSSVGRMAHFAGLALLLATTIASLRPAQAQALTAGAITVSNITGSSSTWAVGADIISGGSGTAPSDGYTHYLRYTVYVSVKYHFKQDTYVNGMFYNTHYYTDTKSWTQISQTEDPNGISSGSTFAHTSPTLSGAFNANDSTFFQSNHASTYFGSGSGYVNTLQGIEYAYGVKVELYHRALLMDVSDGIASTYQSTSPWPYNLGDLSH